MYNQTTTVNISLLNEESELQYSYLYGNVSGKITLYTAIGSMFLGCFLMGGIIAYENFGGDPQKRSMLNRLLSMIFCCLFVYAAIKQVSRIIRDTTGLLEFNSALWIQFFGMWMKISIVFFYNELTIFRYLMVAVWKRMKVIDDSLLAFLLMTSTLMVSAIHPLITLVNGNQSDDIFTYPSLMIQNAMQMENQWID